jgi:hypothetical protein
MMQVASRKILVMAVNGRFVSSVDCLWMKKSGQVVFPVCKG